MSASIEVRRDDLRQKLPRDLMRLTGHYDHPYELEVVQDAVGVSQHDQLVVVWCVADTCKTHTPRGTAVGPTKVCILAKCTLCHPITWWEKVVSMIKIAFG